MARSEQEESAAMTTKRALESMVFRPRPRTQGRAILLELEGVLVAQRWMRVALSSATRAAIPEFIERRSREADVADLLHDVRLSIPRPSLTDAALLTALDRWTAEDRPHPALRALHSLVWEELFAAGKLSVPVLPDAASALLRWRSEGRELFVYSSRPARAQALLLARSTSGGLDKGVRGFFEADPIERREPDFVRSIARRANIDVESLLVLAESSRDLTAAAIAGATVMQVLRGEARSDGEYFWTRAVDTIEFASEQLAAS
jgi:enolase-phosphatase E1